MTAPTPTQSRMPLTPVHAYLSVSWSHLDEVHRTRMLDLISEFESVLRRHDIKPFVSLKEFPPHHKTPAQARDLSAKLRREMARSHLSLFIFECDSIGATLELVHARDALVPVLLFKGHDFDDHTLQWITGLQRNTFAYSSTDEATRLLDQYLTTQRTDVEKTAFRLNLIRRSSRIAQVGRTVRFLRERRSMRRSDLAAAANITEIELKAIEEGLGEANPTVIRLSAIALALGVDLSRLCWPPEQWYANEVELLAVELMHEQRWPIELIAEFAQSNWFEDRPSLGIHPTRESVAKELEVWLTNRNNAN